MDSRLIVVAGAGSIGCFIGGWLRSGGVPVHFLGRTRAVDELRQFGLHLSDCDGASRDVPAGDIIAGTDPEALARATTVLVTVKSGATEEMARNIARYAPAGVPIISLQNGVGNVGVLTSILPSHRVVAGMVPYNVVGLGAGRFHRATGGELVIADGQPWPGLLFTEHGLAAHAHANMDAVSWGKLLINLNNALNALCGLPLVEQLAIRHWRVLFARCMSEAWATLDAAGIVPVPATGVSPRLLPWVLRSPDWLYRRIARRQFQIDPAARSSMWDDLEKRRVTEVGFLQGAVVQLATSMQRTAPVNQRVLEFIRAAEARAQGSPHLDPRKVLRGTG
jgi:2-dehydropantoate 2-reductase